MRLAVDAAREPADDDEPGRGELAPERPRDLRAVRRAGRAPTIATAAAQQLGGRAAQEEPGGGS